MCEYTVKGVRGYQEIRLEKTMVDCVKNAGAKDADDDETTFDKNAASSKTEVATLTSLTDILQLQKEEVQVKTQSKIDSVAISKTTRIVIQVVQTRVSRRSSYIPTPEHYKHSQCGLINIKNIIKHVLIRV